MTSCCMSCFLYASQLQVLQAGLRRVRARAEDEAVRLKSQRELQRRDIAWELAEAAQVWRYEGGVDPVWKVRGDQSWRPRLTCGLRPAGDEG